MLISYAALPVNLKNSSQTLANKLISSGVFTNAKYDECYDQSIFVSDASSFEVHFIDVGQADAALVLCDGKAMLIDGGNAEDSSLIYTYLKNHSVSHLDFIVCTHAHEDHVGGLSGALNYATVDNALAPVNTYDSKAFSNFVTYLQKQNVSITTPKCGESFSFGSSIVNILGPVNSSLNPNNTSLVLRIQYGNTSFLFTGDAEREEELDILDSGCTLSSTVLKVGHHGSDSSTSYPFLRNIMPNYAVISVGAENSYGHPSDDTLSRLRDAGTKVFRTDMQGDIICVSDGNTVSFTTTRNSEEDTLASVGTNSTQKPDVAYQYVAKYVLNTNTMKFHNPNCSSVAKISAANREEFTGTRGDVLKTGYIPCGFCTP